MHDPFPDRLRLPLQFDPARLAADLHGLSGIAWTSHFVAQNYEGDWSVIALRAPAGARHPVRMTMSDPDCASFVDTPALAASPYFRQVLSAFAGPLQAVRLMRLTSGSTIKEHHDHDLSFGQGTVRIHIPVVTNDDVDFRLNGEPCVMPAGSTWYLRLADPHSVANRGAGDRVHLVIDTSVNGWLRGLLAEALSAARPGRACRRGSGLKGRAPDLPGRPTGTGPGTPRRQPPLRGNRGGAEARNTGETVDSRGLFC